MKERLILCHPGMTAPAVAQLQWHLLERKRPSELFFCESPEAGLLLARAGYGVCVLPDLLPPVEGGLWKCALAGAEPLSFGVYTGPGEEGQPLRDLLRLLRETVS